MGLDWKEGTNVVRIAGGKEEKNPCAKPSENVEAQYYESLLSEWNQSHEATVQGAKVRKRTESQEIWSGKCEGDNEVSFHKVFAAFFWL